MSVANHQGLTTLALLYCTTHSTYTGILQVQSTLMQKYSKLSIQNSFSQFPTVVHFKGEMMNHFEAFKTISRGHLLANNY